MSVDNVTKSKLLNLYAEKYDNVWRAPFLYSNIHNDAAFMRPAERGNLMTENVWCQPEPRSYKCRHLLGGSW